LSVRSFPATILRVANENKKINSLVDNSDNLTAEADVLTIRRFHSDTGPPPVLEATEETFSPAADRSAVTTAPVPDPVQAELRDRAAIIEQLRFDLEQSRAKLLGLEAELEARRELTARLDSDLREARRMVEEAKADHSETQRAHEQELRRLRFELSEAQETVAEASRVTEQLVVGLASQRGDKRQLEQTFLEHDKSRNELIAQLEQRVVSLESTVADYEGKLAARSNAIRSLMDELSIQAEPSPACPVDSNSIAETDAKAEEHDGHPGAGERVTRVLVGRLDTQDLRFPLFKPRLTIGRTEKNDIFLNAPHISRRHALIVTEDGTTRIIDRGSRNGVYVNSKRITEHCLKSGDRVAIGRIELRYEELPRHDATRPPRRG
jgi:FHA domain